MARGSFGRSVARAAASGGSRAYRARRPTAWYASIVLIVAAGVSLVVYSRNEKLNPAVVGPTATDNWQSALAVDLCGVVQPELAANPNLSSVGIRTFGNGLINTDPGAVSSGASAYEGANATLGKFASSYPGFKLTDTSITLPGKGAKTYRDGDRCTAANGSPAGAGTLVAKVWSSPTATPQLVTGSVTGIHLGNGEMITLAFVPTGASIPVPASKGALLQALGTSSGPSSTTATTAAPGSKTSSGAKKTSSGAKTSPSATTSSGAKG